MKSYLLTYSQAYTPTQVQYLLNDTHAVETWVTPFPYAAILLSRLDVHDLAAVIPEPASRRLVHEDRIEERIRTGVASGEPLGVRKRSRSRHGHGNCLRTWRQYRPRLPTARAPRSDVPWQMY